MININPRDFVVDLLNGSPEQEPVFAPDALTEGLQRVENTADFTLRVLLYEQGEHVATKEYNGITETETIYQKQAKAQGITGKVMDVAAWQSQTEEMNDAQNVASIRSNIRDIHEGKRAA